MFGIRRGLYIQNQPKADMEERNLIRVIKRAEREQLERQAAESTNSETSARDKARAQAATVKEWISEFRQSRPARSQEIKRQLGWPEYEGNVQGHRTEETPARARRNPPPEVGDDGSKHFDDVG
jgi:hypothetical protein